MDRVEKRVAVECCLISCSTNEVVLTLVRPTRQMLEVERSQIKDLKTRGYSDRQLQEMGFSENSIHTPSVASLKA